MIQGVKDKTTYRVLFISYQPTDPLFQKLSLYQIDTSECPQEAGNGLTQEKLNLMVMVKKRGEE